jgi:hypothetical protein
MYDTVNCASYTAADLDEWMAEETDAFPLMAADRACYWCLRCV